MRYALPALLLALSTATPAGADEGLPPEPATAVGANAVDPDPAQLRDRIAELERRIADLERENGVLRRQWGQATMELDRIRAENNRLKAQVPDTSPTSPGEAASAAVPPTEETAPIQSTAQPQAADARVNELEAEVARLRRQNEDLRGEKAQLTELAGVTAEGDLVASQDARITATYDDATGTTTVRTQPERLVLRQGSHADHYLSLAYEYPGRKMTAPPREVLAFIQATFSGGVYRGEEMLELSLDNQETLTLPIRDHDVAHRQTGIGGKKRVNKGDETVTVALDAEALRKLARSTAVSGRIGRVRFDLTRDAIAMFKAVQKRLEMGI